MDSHLGTISCPDFPFGQHCRGSRGWKAGVYFDRDVYTNPSKNSAAPELCLYKRFALTVMKQMRKSIKQELRGCHKDDVNPGFTMVMKLFGIVIKTSTIFFKIKAPLTTINASYRKFSTNIFKINVWHKDGIN